MKFKFCGDGDCPDWILPEIYNLSMLSSVKLKLLAQVVANGIINEPLDIEKAEKIFTDSKLDINIDIKACIACITYIIKSAIQYNCDHVALHSELQQLGLPREHSNSIKRVVNDKSKEIAAKLKLASLKVNALETFSTHIDEENHCINLDFKINGEEKSTIITPYTLNVLIDNLKTLKAKMVELKDNPYVMH